jgi:hypothetical protein
VGKQLVGHKINKGKIENGAGGGISVLLNLLALLKQFFRSGAYPIPQI